MGNSGRVLNRDPPFFLGNVMISTEKILEQLKLMQSKPIQNKDLLSTGSTLVNLACSNRTRGGLLKGKYYFFVGDSNSGKTWLCLGCLAEASINPNFDGYRLIYDNAEDGALMDVSNYFGQSLADRLESPAIEDGEPVYSSTVEEFYYHLDDAIKKGTPFIYLLDSMDVLSSEDETSKFDDAKKAYRAGKEVPGSYGDGKAKKNSGNLRRILPHLRKTGSILIIINQTRDNLGFGFEKKTRSGGHALKFYACLELWTSVKEKLKKTVRGQARQIGVQVKIQVKKNRITGQDHTVEIPIYHSLGVDDIGSCVDYLIGEDLLTENRGIIKTGSFGGFTGSREKLIRHIEENDLEDELRLAVGRAWKEVQEACRLVRKNRYVTDSTQEK